MLSINFTKVNLSLFSEMTDLKTGKQTAKEYFFLLRRHDFNSLENELTYMWLTKTSTSRLSSSPLRSLLNADDDVSHRDLIMRGSNLYRLAPVRPPPGVSAKEMWLGGAPLIDYLTAVHTFKDALPVYSNHTLDKFRSTRTYVPSPNKDKACILYEILVGQRSRAKLRTRRIS